MLLKVLACSTDTSTLETLNDWAAHNPMVELHTTSSPEVLGELLSSDAFNALILDGRSPEASFSELMPRLALIPGMKVLSIGSLANILKEGSQISNQVETLRTPLTAESLSIALHATNDHTQPPDITATRRDSPSAGDTESDVDLTYLKGWIAEDPPETPLSLEVDQVITPQNAELLESGITPIQPDETTLALNEFSCVLLPRDPQHFLTHAIAERLALTLPWIHANNGWHLTGISIRPQHLHWSVALPATTSPTSAIHEIMQLTSDQLIDAFPDLQYDAADQGFWAREYLAVSGTQSAPYSMIKAFMDRTRQFQSRGE
jgi:REP element-mobilizing transposase RayT